MYSETYSCILCFAIGIHCALCILPVREWLKACERWGFALHLRAHQLLHDMFDDQGVDIDYWSFQALLVTQTLMRGAHAMARQFETVDGLSAFLEDLFALVSAYQLAVPATHQWYQRVMAQHHRMGY